MSKKIILLALAAASVAAFALPAAAMAVETDVALHLNPKPEGAKTIDGEGKALLTSGLGTITCNKSHGTATFESTTTGKFEQTFEECSALGACTTSGQASGVITTTELPFHLATVVDTKTGATGPGLLVTPKEEGGVKHFATFECAFLGKVVVAGNGLVGTITKVGASTTPCTAPAATESTIEFSSTETHVQTHKTVASEEGTTKKHTPTEYNLTANGNEASEDASGILTLGANTPGTLECT